MNIDLSNVEIFDADKLELDKKITFIYGKNGTGKSTLTNEIKKKLSSEYEVSIFQGFTNIIDENRRLNAVVLGTENASINKEIAAKKIEIDALNGKIDSIWSTLQQPDDENTNYWSRRKDAQDTYAKKEKQIEDFYTRAASEIKKMRNPQIVDGSYNKKLFQRDIPEAKMLDREQIDELVATIKSEDKVAPIIEFPDVDCTKLYQEVEKILSKRVTEKIKIERLENNPDKREFAKLGLKIHSHDDVCAFCGNPIKNDTFDELERYFSVSEVKSFQNEIADKLKEIETLSRSVAGLQIDITRFYPSFHNRLKDIKQELEDRKKEIIPFLTALYNHLTEKQKYLFESIELKSLSIPIGLENVKFNYDDVLKNNNENDLLEKKKEASEKLRKHYVKMALDNFEYDVAYAELNIAKADKEKYEREFFDEEQKIEGYGGLKEQINRIQNDLLELYSQTKNETLLAETINKKLSHMISFELVHVDDEESKGFYRVKDTSTGREREITELSTGEKNIIAFLYFIGKLDEIKETNLDKPRVIVFDDPMNSNDDGMQYVIIEELQNLMNNLRKTDSFVLLTHNKHFYLNVTYNHKYDKDRYYRFVFNGSKTIFTRIENVNDDFKTSYESLWCDLKQLFMLDEVSPDLLLNPIRRIIETYTKFNGISKIAFCKKVDGAYKLFNVNSHSIDDVEAELNGKNKKEIIQMLFDCFERNGEENHFKKHWGDVEASADGTILL
ncbi:Wobble nucleotide-excising tRNase [Pseudobutyrivibrio sp. UC1225]|uniref:AAA family ATPase n=1 Tax=Pseudobutyrivibrio sp. UC1225 TaxID=1798185 RepID=UPI0008F18738|nr:AAA family ATPase [Pseudobutyrivibrio sp. UC1225]SFO03714.1 Wobble nucleotide-excising tRNase [Pseudobutyrivibrio sp. UC1225]